MSVLAFPRPPRVIWVCGCGCASFDLHADGGIECAACDTPIGTDEFSGWFDPMPDRDYSSDANVSSNVHSNGSVDFARHRAMRYATSDDAVCIAVVDRDGTVHAWSEADTIERMRWVRRKLAAAAGMIRQHVKHFVERKP